MIQPDAGLRNAKTLNLHINNRGDLHHVKKKKRNTTKTKSIAKKQQRRFAPCKKK